MFLLELLRKLNTKQIYQNQYVHTRISNTITILKCNGLGHSCTFLSVAVNQYCHCGREGYGLLFAIYFGHYIKYFFLLLIR